MSITMHAEWTCTLCGKVAAGAVDWYRGDPEPAVPEGWLAVKGTELQFCGSACANNHRKAHEAAAKAHDETLARELARLRP